MNRHLVLKIAKIQVPRKKFAKYMEKQEVLSKLTESEELHGYNYSEIHTIAAIGDMEFPNVTGISQAMHMTRGAISKITKDLCKME